MKTTITALIIFAFLVSFSLYLYKEATYHFESKMVPKLWFTFSIGGMLAALDIFNIKRVDTFLQKSLIRGVKIVLYLIFADAVFTYCGVIKDPYTNLLIFIAGSGLALSTLLVQLIKEHSKKWIIIAVTILGIYLYFLLAFLGHLTSR